MDVDRFNNIIVTGNNSDIHPNIQIKKLSSSGEELWLKEYDSQGDLQDIPDALALDKNNNIYITGKSVDSIFKGYVLKISPGGDLKWEYHLDELTYEQLFLHTIIVNDSSLFIGGSLYDFLTKSNFFIMKLDQKLSTGINETSLISSSYKLNQNYPNPFNPTTKIKFTIPTLPTGQAGSPLNPSPYQGEGNSERFITLKVYDVLGNEVATLINEEKLAGTYEVEFDGAGLPSGIYFYQLRASNPESSSGQGVVETKKMILIK
jgi:hypothetical protein